MKTYKILSCWLNGHQGFLFFLHANIAIFHSISSFWFIRKKFGRIRISSHEQRHLVVEILVMKKIFRKFQFSHSIQSRMYVLNQEPLNIRKRFGNFLRLNDHVASPNKTPAEFLWFLDFHIARITHISMFRYTETKSFTRDWTLRSWGKKPISRIKPHADLTIMEKCISMTFSRDFIQRCTYAQ